MPKKQDKWPYFNFFDVAAGEFKKIHAEHVKVKTGSTKGVAAGKYYAVVAVGQNENGNNMMKWISEETYNKLKPKLKFCS